MLKSIHLKSAVVALALGGLLAAPFTSQAGTAVVSGKETKNVVEETKQSCISGDLGVNFVSEYISRGLVYENQGMIMQPYVDIYFKLYQGDGFINKVQLQLGAWSSIQSHVYPNKGVGHISGVKNWFEFDYTVALAVTMAKNLTATLSYIEADYPALPSWMTQPNRNIQLGLAYDDTDLLGAFALHPHVSVLRELNTNESGAAGIEKDGWYYEVGIAPSYTALKGSAYPITLTAPITAGFGDANFYAGNTFGFFSSGLNVSVPLAFIPTCFGTWTANAGYTYYYLGNTAAEFSNYDNNNGYINVDSGSRSQHVFSGGIGMTF
jgi:hypothetical protein